MSSEKTKQNKTKNLGGGALQKVSHHLMLCPATFKLPERVWYLQEGKAYSQCGVF